jgi:hypothetical protein
MDEDQPNPLIEAHMDDNPSNLADDDIYRPGRRKNLTAWLVVSILILVACICGVVMLVRGIIGFGETAIGDYEDKRISHGNYERKDTVPAEVIAEETKDGASKIYYLGDEKNGYVVVKDNNWMKIDRVGSGSAQYYTKDYVLLISVLDTSTGDVSTYAKSLYDIAVPSFNVNNVSLDKEKLGNYEDSYKLVMHDEAAGSWTVEWIFKAEDEKIHYILVQGNDLNNEKFKIAETFSLERPTNE